MGPRILVVSVWLLFCGEHAAADGSDWNQHRGNAAGTAASTVEPIRATPVEEWRADLGRIFGEPVSWGGVVYVVGLEGRERRLQAFRARGGERLGSIRLGKPAATDLAVWQGTVVVVDSEGIRTFVHKQGRFRLRKRLKGAWRNPAIYDGLLFVTDGTYTACFDIERGQELFRIVSGDGRPAIRDDGAGSATLGTFSIGTAPGYDGVYLLFHQTRLSGSGADVIQGRTESAVLGLVHDQSEIGGPGYVAVLQSDETLERNWFIRASRPLRAGMGGEFHSCTLRETESGIRLAEIVTDAAVFDGSVFGFSPAGTLIQVKSDGAYHEVVTTEDLPAGARPGAATVAGDVLYLGNWAIEIESRRVLWSRADVEPEGGLIPVADGRAVYVTRAGALVGLVDPRRLELESLPASLAATGKPLRPDAGNVVILDDGRVLVDPDPEEFEPAAVAFVEDSAGPRLIGEQYPVFLAWRNVIYAEFYEELAGLVELYARDRHIGECRRLLAEAEDFGMPPEDLRRLEDVLSGKGENRSANAGGKLAKKKRQEVEVRSQTMDFVLAAAEWCRKRGLGAAATVLLARGRKVVHGANTPELLAAARSLVPASFPWRDEPDAAVRWLRWADEMLPAGAAFVPASDPVREQAGAPWSRDAIALRTENLLIFSLEKDPGVLGPCLRKGEGTLRALARLLPPSPEATQDPLEVRIHVDRESYQAELMADGVALTWSAGIYSPEERISRFFVPRDDSAELLDRQLNYVLAHELTHHYIDQRWMPGAGQSGRVEQPGFWIVEGFARFVEDQILELGRIDRGFTDATVKSLDTTARVAEQDGLYPLRQLIDADYLQFLALPEIVNFEVQLQYTLKRVEVTARGLFYEQAGSLVFFLMNRCGDEGRAALIEYLRDYYLGATQTSGWKALGFQEVDDLERAFVQFMEEV